MNIMGEIGTSLWTYQNKLHGLCKELKASKYYAEAGYSPLEIAIMDTFSTKQFYMRLRPIPKSGMEEASL